MNMGFLSNLFGIKRHNKIASEDLYPEDNFTVVNGMTGDKPIIGSFNISYQNFKKKAEYTWCLNITIYLELENLNENGLPEFEESSIAYELEDYLLSEIKKLTKAHFIGHLFNDTCLDIYVYINEPKKVHDYLQTQINKEGLTRGFGYEIKEDNAWDTVKSFLNTK